LCSARRLVGKAKASGERARVRGCEQAEGTTASDNDWSSTTYRNNPNNAWNVNFNDGNVNANNKNNNLFARAVRGGL
jgi:hypothetical protein